LTDAYKLTASSISTSPEGRLVITGNYSGTYSFGTKTIQISAGSLDDIYLAEFTSDGTPYAATAYAGDGTDAVYGLLIDHQGYRLISGAFSFTVRFVTPLTSAGIYDAFIQRTAPPP
jgi:hypothetical protein